MVIYTQKARKGKPPTVVSEEVSQDVVDKVQSCLNEGLSDAQITRKRIANAELVRRVIIELREPTDAFCERVIISVLFGHELTLDDIARLMGCSRQTVSNIYTEAMRKIRSTSTYTRISQEIN
jgi:DNA-directed RNA polymerase specialized sigma subunit